MYVRVNVIAGAKREEVTRLGEGRYAIRVREPAERNMANGRVRALIAREFGIPEGRVRLISGHQHPHKIFSVDSDS